MSIIACSVDECERKNYCHGMCQMHYVRWKRHGDPLARKYEVSGESDRDPCVIDGCDKPNQCRKMCPMHYQRWRKHGDPSLGGADFLTGCTVNACEKEHYGHGLCSAHYTRNRRFGSPTARLRGEVVDGHKLCSQCQRDLPVGMYRTTNHRGPDELNAYCSTCAKKYVHARRAILASVESDDYKPHEIFARDEWICQLCLSPMDESIQWPGRYSSSVDHIIPLSKGGTDTLTNVQSAHLTCNISKGVKIPA